MPYKDKAARLARQKEWKRKNRHRLRKGAAAQARRWRRTPQGRAYAERTKAAAAARARAYRLRKQATARPRERDYSGLSMDLRIVSKTWRPSDWRQDAEQDRILAELERRARA